MGDKIFDNILQVVNKRESPEDSWAKRSESNKQKLRDLRSSDVAVGIYSGRSFDVKAHNVPSAYGRVMTVLARNGLRRELQRAERHEKPTDKRRRLTSERHRRRFAEAVCSGF